MGSIAGNTGGRHYLYRSSKAALNAVVKSLAIDLRDRGVTVVTLHPGWVKTDMGGADADLEIPDSVAERHRRAGPRCGPRTAASSSTTTAASCRGESLPEELNHGLHGCHG